MKRISVIFFILIFIFLLPSCNKKNIKIYKEDQAQEYVDEFYNVLLDDSIRFVATDFRTKVLYEKEHIAQFQNFDFNLGTLDEYLDFLKRNYSPKAQVFLFIDEASLNEVLDKVDDYYKTIYIYTGSYEKLRELGSEKFIFDEGPYDCRC